jgi:hypothetical protein
VGDILKVEASMPAPYDRSRKSNQSTFSRNQGAFSRSGIGLLALPALIAMVLAAVALVHPKASIWISVQAEFAGSIIDEPSPQTAQSAAPIRTVTPIDVSAGYAGSQR